MVLVSGQPLVRLDVVLKPNTLNFWVILFRVFLRLVKIQTDI